MLYYVQEKLVTLFFIALQVSSVIKICSGYDVMQAASSDQPISNDLKPAGDEAQEQALGTCVCYK